MSAASDVEGFLSSLAQFRVFYKLNTTKLLNTGWGWIRPMNEIEVEVDERVRLLCSALMLTDFPEAEQRYRQHKLHPLAEKVKQALDNLRDHSCVQIVGEVVREKSFLLVVPRFIRLSWPELRTMSDYVVEPWEDLPILDNEKFWDSLRAFNEEIQRAKLWEQTEEMWKSLVKELESVLYERDLSTFLLQFWGEKRKKFIVIPNPLVPQTEPTGLYTDDAYYAIVPPKLVSPSSLDSPSYHVQPVAVRWTVCHELSHSPLFEALRRISGIDHDIASMMEHTPANERFRAFYNNPSWRFTEVLIRSIQVLYLRHYEGLEAEELFLKHEYEKNGLDVLSEWANQLEPYLEGQKTGLYGSLAEFLPKLVKELKAMTEKGNNVEKLV